MPTFDQMGLALYPLPMSGLSLPIDPPLFAAFMLAASVVVCSYPVGHEPELDAPNSRVEPEPGPGLGLDIFRPGIFVISGILKIPRVCG